jgi:transposase
VGLASDNAVWDATTFTKNRERLQQGDLFNRFMETLLHHQAVTPLLSDEHFSVDGTLIEAWAGHNSFKPKSDTDGDGADFHDTQEQHA